MSSPVVIAGLVVAIASAAAGALGYAIGLLIWGVS